MNIWKTVYNPPTAEKCHWPYLTEEKNAVSISSD